MRFLNTGHVLLSVLTLSLLSSAPAHGQMRYTSAPSDPHHHIFAVVPLIGAGTVADPKRPMFTAAQGVKPALPASPILAATTQRTGIIGYHAQITDDGKSAIVEFIAVLPGDFKEILATADSRVQVFQKGVHGKDVMEAAFKAQKKDFSFDKFITLGVK